MGWLRNSLISVIKSLIVIISVGLIFSSTAPSIDRVLQDSFVDIYQYSSEISKAKMLEFLDKGCRSFADDDAVAIGQICNNQSMMESFKANCAEYRSLKEQGYTIKNEEEMENSCVNIESGELERQCAALGQRNSAYDAGKLKETCSSYLSGKIDDKEFFASSISQSFGSIENVDNPFFKKYNRFVSFLRNNMLLLVMSIIALFASLFFLTGNTPLFLLIIGKMCLSISITILLPYALVLAYDSFIGIDTSPILDSVLSGQPSFEPKSILSLVMLMLLKTYNSTMLTLGVILLIIGIIGKIYLIARKKRN